ncbi:MAG TPA: ATP-binding protein [Terriglobia bacterium]|nr:ATP-binding protein [Terriglobia bacterium]
MDVAFELTPLVAGKLIVYSLGSLVHLFLMVLILGQRRLHRLEWLLFALMAALFMWNAGNLLALNVGLFYGVGPNVLSALSRLVPALGLILIPPLMVHVHAQYATQFHHSPAAGRALIALFYAPLLGAPWMLGRLLGRLELDPVISIRQFAGLLVVWLVAALLASAALNLDFRRQTADPRFIRFHSWLVGLQIFLVAGLVAAYVARPLPFQGLGGWFPTFLMLAGIFPSVLMGYSIFRYNFLELRVQRNLVYSIVAIFALLIYVNVIRRVSGYLELRNILPSAVTEGVMIFALVIFLEPVKKQINRLLHAAFLSQVAPIQRFAAEIQEYAKQSGDVEALKRFIELRAPQELGLKRVVLRVAEDPAGTGSPSIPPPKEHWFPVRRGDEVLGRLEVSPLAPELSGDQFGALEFLADQLAAALELCHLIADKIRLERQLAEKAKMAFLGEMATRIAHNVKNPLSSMKTLVQLLEEDTSLPERVRQDCRLVTQEIDRLNHNISQVLRYAKPARDKDRPVDLAVVVSRAVGLSRAEAERRGVTVEINSPGVPCAVEGGEEAASDIVSNLLVNALEASPNGGLVRVVLIQNVEATELWVEDNGSGIPQELKERIFEPFFTTRPGGTGLGLAIVTRRSEEIGGAVECVSPAAEDGRGGSRFKVRFRTAGPAAENSGKESYALHPDRG